MQLAKIYFMMTLLAQVLTILLVSSPIKQNCSLHKVCFFPLSCYLKESLQVLSLTTFLLLLLPILCLVSFIYFPVGFDIKVFLLVLLILIRCFLVGSKPYQCHPYIYCKTFLSKLFKKFCVIWIFFSRYVLHFSKVCLLFLLCIFLPI